MSGTVFEYFRKGSKEAQARPFFTNRTPEIKRFGDVLSAHDHWRVTIDPLDVDVPRRNILNYYGVGGIGKSSLLRELNRKLAESRTPSASALIDFAESSSFSMEDLILRLRTSVGELGKRCVAFDFALTFYWSVVHPGTTLEAYAKDTSTLHKASQRFGLSSAVELSVVEVVSPVLSASQLAHGAARLAQTVRKLVADRSRVKHAIAGCDALPLFLDANNVEQSLSFMPSLLAWDLAQAGNPRVVFFRHLRGAHKTRTRD